MKKSKKLAAIKSLRRRRRRVRNAQLESLDKRLVLSGSPPVAANDLFAVQQDTPLSITAPGLLTNDSDPEGDSLTASLFSGPAHGTLALQADGSFSYTPDAGFAGVDSFTYQADDGTSKSALAAVTLKVGAGGAAPTIDLDADDNPVPGADFIATFTEGGGPVLLADTDAALADGDSSKLASLTVTITNLHDGALESLSADTSGTAITASYDSGSGALTLSGADSVADYLQVLKTVSYDNGSQHPGTADRIITFVANDGLHNSNVATTTLSVVGVNNPPTATNDSYAISEDNTLNIPSGGVLANDTDPDADPLSAILVDGPTNGTLTLNADGSFSYVPNANFNGSDSFTYKANDGTADSNVATVSINVIAVNDPPESQNDAYSLDEDTTLTVAPASSVLVKDTDVEGDPLTAALVSGPQHGTVTLNADGTFTYTPEANFNGIDGFSYMANDGTDNGNVAAVTITVNPVNDPPVAVDDSSYSTDEDTPLVVTTGGVLANDTDVENDPLTAALVDGPQHGTVTLNADGTFTYTPEANFNGTDGFTYKANDGTADSNVAAVTITVNPVNDPPVAVNDDSYSTDEDTPLVVTTGGVLANDTDVENDPLTAALVDGPQHGTVTLNADGTFTYTPDANFNGTDGFTYKANDGTADSNVAAVTITVNPVNDPPAAADDSYSTDEDTPLVVTTGGVLANDTDVENDPLTAALVDAPQHGTVTLNADGTFTYTPDVNFNGTDGFTYKANDGTADSNVAAVTITVNPVNDPPVAVDDSSYSTDEDTPLVVTTGGVLANDTDVENDPLTAALVDAPQHGTVTLNADGTFTYTPEANFNGTDGFTYKANDGTDDSNVAAVTITVNPVNDPPVAVNDDSYSTDEDTPLVVTTGGVLANDTDVENDPLTAALVDGPQHGTVTLNADGTFTYTPDANFNGTDGFTYKANDGTADSNVAAVTITVNPVNDPPVAMNDHYSVAEDTPLSADATGGVLRNDTDVEGDSLSAVLVNGPAHGTLTLNADGSFTYTPDANFNGADGFTYKANDGTDDSNVATVTITVDPVNDPPVGVSDSYSTATDAPLNVNAAAGVLANDTDVDGNPLTATLVSGPQHGTLTLNADGSFSYAPASGFTGADQFTYQASDGEADGNVVTVAITVGGDANQPPVATDDSYTAAQDQTLNVSAPGVLSNDTDAGGNSLTAAVVDGPQHGTLSLNADGSFSYTPNAGYTGADSFTYRANDGTSDSNVATVSLTVDGTVNDRPVAVNDVYAATQDSPLDVPSSGVLANDSDADGDPLTAMLFKGPQHGTLTLNADGSFDYTPDSGFSGLDSFSYQVSDGKVASALAAVTLHVAPSSTASLRLASALANPSGIPASNDAGANHAASLAAVMHDFGLDGQDDLDPMAYPEDSMSAELSQGSKRIPGASEVDAVFDGLA